MRSRLPHEADLEVERVREPERDPERDTVPVGRANDPVEADAERVASQATSLATDYGEAIRRQSRPGAPEGVGLDRAALQRASHAGRSLPAATQADLGPDLGSDTSSDAGHLGNVRIHTGERSAKLADSIGAAAFTHGNDIHFAQGAYAPDTAAGQHVLAHEVAHTAQRAAAGSVHRFPATALRSPVPWRTATASVFHPAVGASGGVYILTSKTPEEGIAKVVAKPVFGANAAQTKETGESLAFGDKVLSSVLGIKVAQTKVVKSRTPEFNHLVAVTKPHQGKPRPEEESTFKPIEQSESFLVMSEVKGDNIRSMAKKSATDKTSGDVLTRTLFGTDFLMDLGKLCVGDILLGNEDRIVFNKMNLGNIMLAVKDGKGTLTAIDTSTVLPKRAQPKNVATAGTNAGGGFANAKSHMESGPRGVLEEFFKFVTSDIQSGIPQDAQDQGDPMWKMFENQAKVHFDAHLAAFSFGWESALAEITALAGNDKQISALKEGTNDDENVSTATLKQGINYIANRNKGKDHQTSTNESMGAVVAQWARQVNTKNLPPPSLGDVLGPGVLRVPGSEARKAEYNHPPSLWDPKRIENNFMNPQILRTREDAPAAIDAVKRRVPAVHQEVNAAVGTKTKRSLGLVGKKKEVETNRGQLAHFVVDTEAVAVGSLRLTVSGRNLMLISDQLEAAAGAQYDGNDGAPVADVLNATAHAAELVNHDAASYSAALQQAHAAISASSYRKHETAAAMDTMLTKAETVMTSAGTVMQRLLALNYRQRASAI
ncbi:MAG TPA: DUF4157 domain-containing protein, partial [Ilumatobacteraceae bacterium]